MAVQPDASNPSDDPLTNGAEGEDIKKLSHGVAIILLFSMVSLLYFRILKRSTFVVVVYVSYLVFQLWSHANLYNDKSENNFQSTRYPARPAGEIGKARMIEKRVESALHLRRSHKGEKSVEKTNEQSPESNDIGSSGESTGENHLALDIEASAGKEEEDEEEQPQLTLPWILGMLVVVTVVSTFLSHFRIRTMISNKWLSSLLSCCSLWQSLQSSSSTVLMALQRPLGLRANGLGLSYSLSLEMQQSTSRLSLYQ